MFYKQTDDLYPKTLAGIAALTLDQWLNDEDANPILVTMRKQQRASNIILNQQLAVQDIGD